MNATKEKIRGRRERIEFVLLVIIVTLLLFPPAAREKRGDERM